MADKKSSVGGTVEKLVGSYECRQGAVRAVRFNTDGNYCLTCGADKTIKLWNPHNGTILKSYSGHGNEVLDAQSSCDNSQICSCSLDKAVLLWDVATGKVVRKFRGHAARVDCVSFNEEGSVILSGSQDGSVRIWDCRSRKFDPIQTDVYMDDVEVVNLRAGADGIAVDDARGIVTLRDKVLDEAKDSITSLFVTDYEILTGSVDCRLRRYDIRSGELCSDFIGSPVTCVSLTRDGQCVLNSTLDSTLRLLDKESGELLNEYKGHVNSEYKIDSMVSSDDKQIVSGSEDGFVHVWDLISAALIGRLEHEQGKVVHSLSYHPTESCLVSACGTKLYVWKSKYGQSMDT